MRACLGIREVELFRTWFGQNVKFTLLFRGSFDGFTAWEFNAKLLNKANTFHLVKSEHNKVFGGFKKIVHAVIANYSADADAFIFSLTDLQKLDQYQNPEKAIYTHLGCLTTFGGHDIYISD